jgi:nanoRNase/pAp phosphatase (c-di-AMP/oligoRNAs hydrolase)
MDVSRPVVIQVHDFPDHDAVAAGMALWHMLTNHDFSVHLLYSGEIQSASLEEAVELLEIPLKPLDSVKVEEKHQLILVDGFVGNKNVTDLPAELIALIDHHSPPEKPQCPYFDIRPEIGSCSTILYEYFRDTESEIPKACATALLMGIMMDTAFMTRGVTPNDLEAFEQLFFQGDWETSSRLLKNSLSLSDLAVFREAMAACEITEDFAFVPLPEECSPEVMALTADFFLGLREIKFVVVMTPSESEYRISVRSEDDLRPTDVIIRKALRGVGYGGGHVHMGGGNIPRNLFPGEQTIRNRFIDAMALEEPQAK